MPNIDEYELEVLSAYEKGKLKSVATKRDVVGRPPTAKPDSVTDFGGRR